MAQVVELLHEDGACRPSQNERQHKHRQRQRRIEIIAVPWASGRPESIETELLERPFQQQHEGYHSDVTEPELLATDAPPEGEKEPGEIEAHVAPGIAEVVRPRAAPRCRC